ncbi:NADP-dependent oxidoreductase [Nocardia seriolae]|uniref:NADP-dependent oxidoreductase n=1 Tax=Nocardia seriolae TaxID=37332 RepID=A0A0B8NCB8_9NOCA|nr:NADP-dependent oxidoreductase [Nocardia seriolae]APA94345.1 Putative NADP-dependent oxidoreductase YfmJ [Nocardia seriolae]MTJ60441.1 zinc-binding dehydrogenase [Nocardia seriolae]MTJ72507.1 zinc-binding dehydrogenase [Nocardia seriolae]MTJ84671.1 zinc-binding dehydrogenase [Nocardia seriolae]MTK28659.1 zinc-binding dehydrogenase [Nocardia seriolae]
MTTQLRTGREIRLAARPQGVPTTADFVAAERPLPELRDGQLLVRNTWMSVDPYMRGRMDDKPSYVPPFRLGEPLEGAAVGEVIESRSAAIPLGATVTHFRGWRDLAVVDADTATVVDTTLADPRHYLGALGTTGLTAYAALTSIAPVRPGDVVFVSAAAGAVGSVAGQIARKPGASRVVGSAGGPAKNRVLLDEFGFDAAIDHRAGDLRGQLAAAAPEGIDVYLDGVGSEHLAAAIEAMRPGGRIAMVGAISGYDGAPPEFTPDLYLAATKEITLRGMLVTSRFPVFGEYIGRAAGWLADGSLRTRETVYEGLDRAPAAFLGVLSGANTGKMLVRLA